VRMMQQMLKSLGYRTNLRISSVEALELFRANPQKYDLVITDHIMPNLSGLTLAKEMKIINPGVPIILCTGYSEILTEEQTKAAGISRYVMKPLVKKEIALLIRETLDELN